ncbi:uncharacterized protein NECHADRAFT_85524 [Fusarium vanettenii 77-13-4]|uniref:F-box domain-containing protein n=1 Tax=Fusarium vanettenii (strain ATCC MYA-4622 / CBS 123669 / FGSC 9596 / NRRL 45880 / 77-13-4) TaxID=660122 RepID=C7ZNS5_FUSV7|nr:uncharacterized protein NECHADRAFT_85524 [Fusarium vanettenii 77-13-4]EEU34055.1 hypothetical protein NECHADRAFT_85524 [Fusarium vanettenii 77-13-4]
MTQPAAPWHGWPNEPASIERLPPELLLPLVSSLPGLDTLWNLMRASPNTLRLFNCHANTITEGILSGPNSILPSNVQELVRGVILARSKSLPFKNLNDFQVRHMFGLFDPSMAKETELITLGPGTLSVSNPPVAVLRSVVATAYQISALSQACLASCLERTRALRVMHPIDPKICYTDDYDRPNKIVPAFDRKYPGTPAKMVDAGQPTWVEEMRAVRAIWVIQMVGEMRRLSSNKADMIDWPDKDIDRLNKLDLAKFFRVYRADYDGQEITSAEEYLKTLGEVTHDVYHRLPRPPPASPVTRWTTALPIPENTTWVVRGYVLNREFHRLHPGSSLPAGAKPWKAPKYSKDHSWGKTDTALNDRSYGVDFFRDLSTNEVGPQASPLYGVEFDSFRPLGFAFWDRWRMHLLGLAPKKLHFQLDFYYYAWESILPPEEVMSVKNAHREDWWRSMAKYNATLAAGRAQQRYSYHSDASDS